MITINVQTEQPDLETVINLARQQSVLILTADGREFFLAEADDFEQEVAALRASQSFQKFLDVRTGARKTIPLEDIEAEIEAALAPR